jgi:hypothetical protein
MLKTLLHRLKEENMERNVKHKNQCMRSHYWWIETTSCSTIHGNSQYVGGNTLYWRAQGQLRNYLSLECSTCMKMETAAIFHVVHSKVTSIVLFVMKVTSRVPIVGKKAVTRVWRKHYALRNACMHQMLLVTGQICVKTCGLDPHKRVQPRLPVVQALSRFENVRCI